MATVTAESNARPIIRLRADVFTARMRARGYTTVTAQAEAVGCTRQALHDLLAGYTGPRPRLARRISTVSEASLPNLIEVVAE